jgi:hypothetical protein
MSEEQVAPAAVPRRAPTFQIPGASAGIGGWLLLFLITQGVAAVWVLAGVRTIVGAFTPEVWAIGQVVPHYHLLAVSEAVMWVAQVVCPPVGITLAIRRYPRTPLFFEIYLAAIFAYHSLHLLLAPQVYSGIVEWARSQGAQTTTLERAGDDVVLSAARGMAYAVLWFFYWLRSIRVDATFREPAAPRVAPN